MQILAAWVPAGYRLGVILHWRLPAPHVLAFPHVEPIPHVAFFFLDAHPSFSSLLSLSSPLAHARDSRLTRSLGPSRRRAPPLLIKATGRRHGCILSPSCALWRCCSSAQAAGRGLGGYAGQTCSRGRRTPSDRASLATRATGQRCHHACFVGGGGGAQEPRVQPVEEGCMRGGRLRLGSMQRSARGAAS
jgi:hypothetical protein